VRPASGAQTRTALQKGLSARLSLLCQVSGVAAFMVLMVLNSPAVAATETLSSPYELVNPAPAASDSFGCSVSTSAKIAAVGADYEGPQGTVFIFRETGSGWTQTAKLKPTDPDASAGDE
jgi:hypothetical protein